MRRMTTCWRNLGGLLAACVLALLVVAPTTGLAACLCIEDTVAPASANAVQTVHTDQREDGAPCKAACCVGGHCHHAGSLFVAPIGAVVAPAPKAAKVAPAPGRALASRPLSAIDRPPRV